MEEYYRDRIEGFKKTYTQNPVGKKVAERIFEEIRKESFSNDFGRRIYIGLEGDKIYNSTAKLLIAKSNVPEKIRKIIDSEEYRDEFPYAYYHLINIMNRQYGPLGLGYYKGYVEADVIKANDIYKSRRAKVEKKNLNNVIKVAKSNNKNNGRL